MSKRFFKLMTMVTALVTGVAMDASAQCAMCRATLENNVSNGDIGIAAGINFGILYLFAAPYIAICVIGIMWYRTSKRNATNQLNKGPVAG